MFEAQTEIKNTIVVNTAELLTERKGDESKHAPMLRTRGMIWAGTGKILSLGFLTK